MEDFSPSRYFNDITYKRVFKKYFKKNIFLDTFAFCLIIQGKFDYNHGYDTLGGDRNFFMNVTTYKKLIKLLGNTRLIITPSVVSESLGHMFEAIETKYGTNQNRKHIEEEFVNFLQNEILLFKEKHPFIKEILTHKWVEEIKHKKIRDRIELGELSIFVECDKCKKYSVIVTNDRYEKNKEGECYSPHNAIIIQLDALAFTETK